MLISASWKIVLSMIEKLSAISNIYSILSFFVCQGSSQLLLEGAEGGGSGGASLLPEGQRKEGSSGTPLLWRGVSRGPMGIGPWGIRSTRTRAAQCAPPVCSTDRCSMWRARRAAYSPQVRSRSLISIEIGCAGSSCLGPLPPG